MFHHCEFISYGRKMTSRTYTARPLSIWMRPSQPKPDRWVITRCVEGKHFQFLAFALMLNVSAYPLNAVPEGGTPSAQSSVLRQYELPEQ